jgi:hypothetical protein
MSAEFHNKWLDVPSRLRTVLIGGPIALFGVYAGGPIAAVMVLVVGLLCAVELQQMIVGDRRALVPTLVIGTAIMLAATGAAMTWFVLLLALTLLFFSLHMASPITPSRRCYWGRCMWACRWRRC